MIVSIVLSRKCIQLSFQFSPWYKDTTFIFYEIPQSVKTCCPIREKLRICCCEDDSIIVRVPSKISTVCSLLPHRGRLIVCCVTGKNMLQHTCTFVPETFIGINFHKIVLPHEKSEISIPCK